MSDGAAILIWCALLWIGWNLDRLVRAIKKQTTCTVVVPKASEVIVQGNENAIAIMQTKLPS